MTFVTLGLALLCGVLLYSVLDQAVSLDYGRQGALSLESDREILRRLLLDLARTTSRRDVESLLDVKYRDTYLVKAEGDSVLWVGGIGLRFEDGRLADVLFDNEAAAVEGGAGSEK